MVARGATNPAREVDEVVIRIAGDSGDGIQLTGAQLTAQAAQAGNDLATLPDFPAEIRAPAGTRAGVSGFQLHFADHRVLTPGDAPNVLVALNPAALAMNLADLPAGAELILDADEFTARNLARVGYAQDPRTDGTLDKYVVREVPMTSTTVRALAEFPSVGRREAERARNFFALGLLSWLYHRDTQATLETIARRFAATPELAAANAAALRAGFAYGETTEAFGVTYRVAPAALPAGRYRNVTGNLALAYGLLAASRLSGLPLFLGSYPITPASDLLHELSKHKALGVRTFQAEDEIAGVGAALGASYGGALGVTTTSGPGVALKTETISLAVSLELPLVVCDVQRAGPSTGMPTKAEQSDLLAAIFGRPGESPLPVVAARSPADCFDTAIEAVRLATTYRTPVFLLSDGSLANGSEPWRLPRLAELPDLTVTFAREPNHVAADGSREFWPYLRDPDTLARAWAIPGTRGLEHRIGGLEKADGSGEISYDPDNHEQMVRLRAAKIARIAAAIPDLEVDDPSGRAQLLVLGWGSTYGVISSACRRLRAGGIEVAHAHLRHLNPFPANTAALLRAYARVVVPEMNLGQLALLVRAHFLVDARSLTSVRGVPMRAADLADALRAEVPA